MTSCKGPAMFPDLHIEKNLILTELNILQYQIFVSSSYLDINFL